MKAIIDIKTPAGQSLEGFPLTENCNPASNLIIFDDGKTWVSRFTEKIQLHSGDKITIEIV